MRWYHLAGQLENAICILAMRTRSERQQTGAEGWGGDGSAEPRGDGAPGFDLRAKITLS